MVTGRIHICWYQNPPLNVVQTAGGCAIRAQPICLREVRRGGRREFSAQKEYRLVSGRQRVSQRTHGDVQ